MENDETTTRVATDAKLAHPYQYQKRRATRLASTTPLRTETLQSPTRDSAQLQLRETRLTSPTRLADEQLHNTTIPQEVEDLTDPPRMHSSPRAGPSQSPLSYVIPRFSRQQYSEQYRSLAGEIAPEMQSPSPSSRTRTSALKLQELVAWKCAGGTNESLRSKLSSQAHDAVQQYFQERGRDINVSSKEYAEHVMNIYEFLIAQTSPEQRAQPSTPRSRSPMGTSISPLQLTVPTTRTEKAGTVMSQPRASSMLLDPVITSAVDRVNAPRQSGESSEQFEVRRSAARRLRSPPVVTSSLQESQNRTSQREGTTAPSSHIVPPKADRVPMNDDWKNRVAYQQMRNDDLKNRGTTRIDDQGIVFEGHVPIDEMKRVYYEHKGFIATGGAPDGGGSDDGDDDEHNNSNRGSRDPRWNSNGPPRREGDNSNGGNGGDPPRGGYPGSTPPVKTKRTVRGFSMPPANMIAQVNPGVALAVQNHKETMHDRLCTLIREHVSQRLEIPPGTKLRRTNSESVGMYVGKPKFSDLENWVTSLVLLLEASQYGGADRDRERVIAIAEFLGGEAKLWYNRHVIHPNRTQLAWTFEEVIVSLYDRFVHPSTMQDAREAFLASRYSPERGVQGFFDTLQDHAQNMASYPDAHMVIETFLKGLPAVIREKLFELRLSPEVNTIDDFVSEAKAIEMSMKNAEHFRKRATTTSGRNTAVRDIDPRINAKKREDTPAKRPHIKRGEHRKAHFNRDQGISPRPASGEAQRNPQREPRAQDKARGKQPFRPRPGMEARTEACYNCGKPGHYAKECPSPKREKAHVRAAHTELPDRSEKAEESSNEGEPRGSPSEENHGQSDHDEDDNPEEVIEMESYQNDWYERDSEASGEDFLYTMEDTAGVVCPPKTTNKKPELQRKIRKVMVRATKEARKRPALKAEDKACLATYTTINGCEAWTLWDSGSTTTGITPALAQVADVCVFPLEDPHILQLGTVGSRSTINYGAEIELSLPGTKGEIYADIANFDRYDMIIGTPYMRANKVQLDFEKNVVVVNGTRIPATPVELTDGDGRLRRYRTTEKRRE